MKSETIGCLDILNQDESENSSAFMLLDRRKAPHLYAVVRQTLAAAGKRQPQMIGVSGDLNLRNQMFGMSCNICNLFDLGNWFVLHDF